MGVVEVKLAKREAQLEFSPEDPFAILSSLVTELKVEWSNKSFLKKELGNLTTTTVELSPEKVGLESFFLGKHANMTSSIFFNFLPRFVTHVHIRELLLFGDPTSLVVVLSTVCRFISLKRR